MHCTSQLNQNPIILRMKCREIRRLVRPIVGIHSHVVSFHYTCPSHITAKLCIKPTSFTWHWPNNIIASSSAITEYKSRRTDKAGFESWQGQTYLFSTKVQTGSEVKKASYSTGSGVSFPQVKLPEREADH